MTVPAIRAEGLVKSFGRVRALDGLTMEVPTGAVHGFLGPHGAGKSTTLRVLLGLLRPDAGSVELLGGDPWTQAPELHRRLAYVPGDVNLWPTLTGGEAIDVIGRSRGGLDPARRAELVEAFELDTRKKGRTYSKGNRQKVALVAALASDVELLLLDEPTSGLDPLMERVFTEQVRTRTQAGCTVLLSSHILSEVEQLCDSVSIIKAGRVVESGSLDRMRHLHRVELVADLRHRPEGIDTLPGLVGPTLTETPGGGFQLRAHAEADALDELLRLLSEAGVRQLSCTPPTLEELFLSHYDTSVQPDSDPVQRRDDDRVQPHGHAGVTQGNDPRNPPRDGAPVVPRHALDRQER